MEIESEEQIRLWLTSACKSVNSLHVFFLPQVHLLSPSTHLPFQALALVVPTLRARWSHASSATQSSEARNIGYLFPWLPVPESVLAPVVHPLSMTDVLAGDFFSRSMSNPLCVQLLQLHDDKEADDSYDAKVPPSSHHHGE